MQTPQPPSQEQANEAQQARFVAENAILNLFKSVSLGGGGGDDDNSSLYALRITTILVVLSTAIVFSSFRYPQDRSKSLLLSDPPHNNVADDLLNEAQKVFKGLVGSELTNEQRAGLWATWAYSRAAESIAEAINSEKITHQFTEQGLKIKKVWISRSDKRVRPLHAKLHGTIVPSSNDFWRWPNTGQQLRWPGDQNAPPETTIGCRCVCLLSWASQDDVTKTIQNFI